MKFSIQQRKEIRQVLLDFVEGRLTWNEMPRSEARRDDLEMIELLEDLLNALKVSAWTEHLFWESGLERNKVEAIPKLLLGRYVGWRSFFSGRVRPFDHSLWYLLDDLESIFKEAGGGATEVSHNDFDERECRFVEFVAADRALMSAYRGETDSVRTCR